MYTKLGALFATHACKEYKEVFKLLEETKLFSPDAIPQLEDVSNFLKGLYRQQSVKTK